MSQTWTYSFEVLRFLISCLKAPCYSTFLLHASYWYNSTRNKILPFWFITRFASLWSPFSQVIGMYCYYKDMVLRSMWYCYVCIKIQLCREFCFVLNCPMVQRSFPFSQILNLFIFCYFRSQNFHWYLGTKNFDQVFPTLHPLLLLFQNGKTEKSC